VSNFVTPQYFLQISQKLKSRLAYCITVLLLLFPKIGSGQDALLDTPIRLEVSNVRCEVALELIRQQTGINIIYGLQYLPKKTFSFEQGEMPLRQVLSLLFRDTRVAFQVIDGEIVLRELKAEELLTISGKVTDGLSGEELVGTLVYLPNSQKGAVSDVFGKFSLSLQPGRHQLIFKTLGYQTDTVSISLTQDRRLEKVMMPQTIQLKEVEILSQEDYISKLQVASYKLNPKVTRQLPYFMGEADVVKTLQLLPGVQSGTEGYAGFFVRGGGADQNLVLLDGAPVFNATHFGFFSVFNPDLLKDVNFYRGGIPAHFGGRLSSVLDVSLKEGNFEDWEFSGAVGSLVTRGMAEGPLVKDKLSVVLAGRRTFADLLLRGIPNNLDVNRVYFYDINAKLDWKAGDNHRLSLSGYFGRDRIGYTDFLNTTWGNQAASLRWDAALNPKLFSKMTAYTSYFRARSSVNLQEAFSYVSRYNLRNIGWKQQFRYFPSPVFEAVAGAELNYQRYFFGEIRPLAINSVIQPQSLAPSYALESAVFGSMNWKISEKLRGYLGVRLSRLDNLGPATVLVYDQYPVSPESSLENVIDSLQYGSGESTNTFEGIEPRASLRYMLTPSLAIKASFSRTRQYINQLSNSNVPSPVDMWAPVNRYILPQIGNQYALGAFAELPDPELELSVEAYYKEMDNQVEFKPLASLALNNHLETELLQGSGTSYGIESMIRKNKGRLSGWATYTYSRSERQVPGINSGKPYPASFDRRHDVSIVLQYQLNKKLDFSANWTYASGVAYTVPVGRYEKNGIIVPYYTERNGFRLPPVHRLDLSATLSPKPRPGQKHESKWHFSIYNVYNRKNTFAYVFRQKRNQPNQTEVVKLYLFTIIPSVSYSFNF